jgi:hypothetical protein
MLINNGKIDGCIVLSIKTKRDNYWNNYNKNPNTLLFWSSFKLSPIYEYNK